MKHCEKLVQILDLHFPGDQKTQFQLNANIAPYLLGV